MNEIIINAGYVNRVGKRPHHLTAVELLLCQGLLELSADYH